VPREGYGVKRVAVTLEDGTEYSGVRVAWGTEVVAVQRYGPFRLIVTLGFWDRVGFVLLDRVGQRTG